MTKRERMAAYREAARAIAEGQTRYGCCNAIYFASTLAESQRFMASAFRPQQYAHYWWPLDDRDSRVIALLLAAEMVRTGDL